MWQSAKPGRSPSSEEEAVGTPHSVAERERPGGPKMTKILIVEDEPAMVSGLRDNFEFEGYEVITEIGGHTTQRSGKGTAGRPQDDQNPDRGRRARDGLRSSRQFRI